MKSLQTRKDIVIKPADKGGSVCVWDKTLYIQEAETQLYDSKFYTKLLVYNMEMLSETGVSKRNHREKRYAGA